jgi:Fe2+ transport system protein FeoA
VVRKTIMGGPIIVSHRGTQVAIGNTLARKILVEEIA